MCYMRCAIERQNLRIRVTAGFWLDLHVVLRRTFHESRHIFGVFGSRHRNWFNFDIEIVSVDPGDLVKRVVRKCDAVVTAVADGSETVD